MNKSKQFLRVVRKKAIIYSSGLILLLVLVNEGFLLYSNKVLKETTAIKAETQEIKDLLTTLWDDVVRNIDLGVRGYALTKDEGLLFPYRQGISLYQTLNKQLLEALKKQGYKDVESFEKVKNGYNEYIQFMTNMNQLVKEDNMVQFQEELKKDKGLALWKVYEKFSSDINAYENEIHAQAVEKYNAATFQMSVIQTLLGIIGTPTLLFMMYWFNKDEKKRRSLFEELDKNNRKYIFDPGTSLESVEEREVINNSIINFQKATGFISEISSGNFEANWDELNDKNKELNKNNLVGELMQMREKMRELKAEDSKRMWATEGLANFSEIVRDHQHDLKKLSEESVSYIVKYLSAQQGALFVLKEEEDQKYLELENCHAFNKKKYLEKRIEIGQGLVGQVYLEQQIVKLTEIPQGYTTITSGLGEATPTCLLVVPMRYNEKVEAVLEIAGFENYEKYQMDWLVKIGEIMASTLVSLKTTDKTHEMLERFKEQTEEMRAQEEELRQNMEELEATQEEMRRKEKELERRYQDLQESNVKKK